MSRAFPLCVEGSLYPGTADRFEADGRKIALIRIETGEALTWPATRPTPVFEVVVADGMVNVVLPDDGEVRAIERSGDVQRFERTAAAAAMPITGSDDGPFTDPVA